VENSSWTYDDNDGSDSDNDNKMQSEMAYFLPLLPPGELDEL